MKLTTVKFSKLEHTEYFQFLKQLVALINQYDATKLKLSTALNPLVGTFPNLQAALDKEAGNQITQTLNRLDAERDELIIAFRQFLQAMCSYPDTAIADSAKPLLNYVHSFGKDIAKQTMLAETTIITQIVDGFTNNNERKNALAAIHGSLWITALGNVNTAFAQAYNTRITDTTSNNKVASFTEQKKAVLPLYNELIDLIEGRYKTAKADGADVAPYEKLIAEINQLIASVNLLAENPPKTKKLTVPADSAKK